MRVAAAFFLLLLLLTPTSARATSRIVPPIPSLRDETLAARLARFAAEEPAIFGIAVKHLDTGQYASFNGGRVFEAASLYKLAVMAELFAQNAEGSIDLDERFDAWSVVGYDGAGYAIWGKPTTYSAREALVDMITLSDNAAAEYLLFRLGQERINERMRDLGLPNTTVDWDTTTTPDEILRLLELIATGALVSREASEEMLAVLLDQQVNDRIPAGLPAGTPIAHKTGNLGGLVHDAAIVYAFGGPFILVILTEDLWDEERGPASHQRLARLTHDYFEERSALVQPLP
ncbi:MAG: serine hydrolase [Dehalococcoidia bacterium]